MLSKNEVEIRGYLKTLRLLPRDIILDVSARPYDMGDSHSCLLGWSLRAALGKAANRDPALIEDWEYGSPPDELHALYGGSYLEWENIYCGVTNVRLPWIERAWVRRMNELIRVRTHKAAVEDVLLEVATSVTEGEVLNV